jgi:hypothetical protein
MEFEKQPFKIWRERGKFPVTFAWVARTSELIQPHIAAPAKHLQAIMMLWLKPEASFRSEGNGNGQGNQSCSTYNENLSRRTGYWPRQPV